MSRLSSLYFYPHSRRAVLLQLASFLGGSIAIAACSQAEESSSLIVGFLMGAGGLGDLSFNDMTYAGLQKAQRKYGSQILVIPQELAKATDQEAARENAMKALIREKPSLIVVNGFEFQDLTKRYAEKYPSIRFLINDVELSGLPNVAYTSYGQHEGSFLAGALAAWMSKTKKVGVIGGVDIDVVKAFHQGYQEGVAYADPSVQVRETFVSRVPDFSGFSNPEVGYQLAIEQYEQGADIVFAVAGFTGNGVIRAAKDQNKLAIGVDADQDHLAAGNVLTSMMKRLDNVTLAEVSKVVDGNFKAGGTYYGLKEGGVSLSPMKYTRQLIPPEILQKLEDTQNKIIAGEIQVTNVLGG
ncbi:MAG: BMP family ABC transporter substrate-binding protein [Cyanobacteriota bacterium]|nr:BMP family ABC transporter substrate-binding protein [Cyanobacteriota bacterium]